MPVSGWSLSCIPFFDMPRAIGHSRSPVPVFPTNTKGAQVSCAATTELRNGRLILVIIWLCNGSVGHRQKMLKLVVQPLLNSGMVGCNGSVGHRQEMLKPVVQPPLNSGMVG